MPSQNIIHLPRQDDPLHISARGLDILNDPWLNKGTSFTLEERKELGLSGLLPPFASDMEEQLQRVLENYRRQATPLDKYVFLTGLADRNVTLFYRVLMENLEETTPIMYTPTVGRACQKFGHIYRKNRGLYIQRRHRGRIAEVLGNWPRKEIDIIVISDGSRILGLGDLGANGMGIPIGKLVLYVVGAGLHPDRTLPILLDVGTNNEELLNDPLYLGMSHRRVPDEEFYEIVDEFVQAAKARWPNVLIQWEDFTNDKAFPLLNRYRDEVLCFNDDIQGTGAVALSGLLAAMRHLEGRLSDQRIVFFGAGSASVGIADMICAGIADEHNMTTEEARKLVWMVDSRGLVSNRREGELQEHKLPYAREDAPAATLLDVVKRIKPTIIIGASGQPQTFNEAVIREMHRHCDRPIIFALSNPTSKSECTAEQAYEWTAGHAIFASGSPFRRVRLEGRIFIPGQGNNMFIFPGVGLGAIACGAETITDEMFFTAAKTLANMVTDEELAAGTLYPDLRKIRQISLSIATSICRLAWDNGIARYDQPDDIRTHVRRCMWNPKYRPFVAE
ncbi:MAG: NAD-dependent malic enzyme [Xanthomonadales bacterium]|jgi:malate dehydrogenase (oxaloacetate-decarboxylating)(NADP+)|nr:NAD-dependent malic enzyme [Xanthomonadales bacterium]